MQMSQFLLIVSIILLVGSSPPMAQQPQPQFPSDYFDCVATGSTNKIVTVVCDSPNRYARDQVVCQKNPKDPNCEHVSFDIPESEMSVFSEWQIAPAKSYSEPPRFQAVPQKGQLLKARWDGDGNFQAVASCEARAYRAVQAYCRDNHYCRHPLSLLSQPGCGRDPSPFIKSLLATLK